MKPSISTGAFLVLALAGATQARSNTCGNEGTPPLLVGTEVVGPQTLDADGEPPFGWETTNLRRLSRGGVHYISGNYIRVRLVTDRCTFIAGVRFGTRVVTPTNTGGFWYFAQEAYPPASDPAQYAHSVMVHFPYAFDGATQTLTLVVGRSGGSGTVEASVPVVRVKSVEANHVLAPMSFSRAEMYNMFARALAAKFGPENSTVIELSDGSHYRIYDYDANDLSVTVSSQGVGFQFVFKTDIPGPCNPRVRAYGKFRLEAGTSGFWLSWPNPAQASLTWPTGCEIVESFPIVGLLASVIDEVIEDRHSNSIAATVEQEVLASLPDPGAAVFYLAGTGSRTDELWVNLSLPVPSITLALPYDAFDMGRNATAFAAGERVSLTASGLGMNDSVADGGPDTFTAIRSGPNGVPRAGTTDIPRPCAVSRTASPVLNTEPVARVLARTATLPFFPRRWAYEPGCAVVAPASSTSTVTSVRFGVNDSASDAQRLRAVVGAAPGYLLRVHFLGYAPSLASSTPLCRSYDTSRPRP